MKAQNSEITSSRGPSATEWEAQKPSIIGLYKTHTLNEVRRIMEEQHSFRANKRQYDRKFEKWGVSKYMTKAAKAEFLSTLLRAEASDDNVVSSRTSNTNITPRDRAKLLRYLHALPPKPSTTANQDSSLSRREQILPAKSEKAGNASRERYNSSSKGNAPVQTRTFTGENENKVVPRVGGRGYPPAYYAQPTISYASSFQPPHVSWKPAQRVLAHEEDESPPANDYVFGPFLPTQLPQSATINVKRLLQSIDDYFASGKISLGYEDRLTTYSTNGPNPPPSHEFWANLKRGIYLDKVESYELALPALNKACALAPVLLNSPSSFDFHFLRELFLTLSPVSTKASPQIRLILLTHLKEFAHYKLTAQHPISIICHELQLDREGREVSEKALICMLESVRKYCSESIEIADMEVRLECSIVTLLRRDKELDAAVVKAKALVRRTLQSLPQFWNFNQTPETIRVLKRARMTATELAHIYMDMEDAPFEEALSLCFFVLTGYTQTVDVHGTVPPNLPHLIHDSKSFHTMEDIAKIYHEVGNMGQAMYWLEQATTIGKGLFDPDHAAGKTALAFIAEKMRRLREGRGGKTDNGSKRYDI